MSRSSLVAALGILCLSLLLSPAIPDAAAKQSLKVHRAGDEGYFSGVIPLPEDAPAGPLSIVAKPKSGDVYLVHASQPQQGSNTDITLTGRFGNPGTASVVIMARPAQDLSAEYKHLITVSLNLAGSEHSNLPVMKTWALHQQRRINAAAFGGNDSFAAYWNLAATQRYGLEPSQEWLETSAGRIQPDFFSIFTDAVELQENLQIEILGRKSSRRPRADSGQSPSSGHIVSSLNGPTITSHPYDDLLKGRNLRVPALSNLIPADQYAVFFGDINKQLELLDLMEDWGGSLLETMQTRSRDFSVRKKIMQQLCLETSMLTGLHSDRIIGPMALTGNDPFLKEGSDISLLFTLKNKDVFLQQIDAHYTDAASTRRAQRSEFSSSGQKHIVVTSFDRRVSSYTVVLGDVAVVSNSLDAMRRVIDTAAGKTPSLGAARDFQYLRTFFSEGDENEDVFAYFSDAHLRKLVGPVVKISEARRMTCAANLQIMANARFWFKAERKREPTLQELIDGGYLGDAHLTCPNSGNYALERGTGVPTCSIHNRTGYLTPLVALPAGIATAQEEGQYKTFVENYDKHGARFFDPIGIRIKLGEQVRIQTLILPLTENSWYDGLAAFSGRETAELSEAPLLQRNILSLRGRVLPEWRNNLAFIKNLAEKWKVPTHWLGSSMSLNFCDGPVVVTIDSKAAALLGKNLENAFPDPNMAGYLLSALNLPTYLSLQVIDADQAARAIPLLVRSINEEYRSDNFSIETYSLEPYHGRGIYVLNVRLSFARTRLFAAVIRDQLVIASRHDIVTDLIDNAGTARPAGPANLEFSLYRTAFRNIEPAISLAYQENLRQTCHKNLTLVETLLTIGGAAPDDLKTIAFPLRGFEPTCPSGGRYELDPDTGKAQCPVHGTVLQPTQPAEINAETPIGRFMRSLKKVNATLSFAPEGLMATIDLQRTVGKHK